MLAYVISDGCKTANVNELRGLEPWGTEFDMLVKVIRKPKTNDTRPLQTGILGRQMARNPVL